MEVAAAGAHNDDDRVAGFGKTMLEEHLVRILPPLKFAETIETTKVYSVAGLLGWERGGWHTRRRSSRRTTRSIRATC